MSANDPFTYTLTEEICDVCHQDAVSVGYHIITNRTEGIGPQFSHLPVDAEIICDKCAPNVQPVAGYEMVEEKSK